MELLEMIEYIVTSLFTRIKRYIYFTKFDAAKEKFARKVEDLNPNFKKWVVNKCLSNVEIVIVKTVKKTLDGITWPSDVIEEIDGEIISDPQWGLGTNWNTYIELLLKNHLELYVIENGKLITKSEMLKAYIETKAKTSKLDERLELFEQEVSANTPHLYTQHIKKDDVLYVMKSDYKYASEILLQQINECWPNSGIQKEIKNGIKEANKTHKKRKRKLKEKYDSEIKDIKEYFKKYDSEIKDIKEYFKE